MKKLLFAAGAVVDVFILRDLADAFGAIYVTEIDMLPRLIDFPGAFIHTYGNDNKHKSLFSCTY